MTMLPVCLSFPPAQPRSMAANQRVVRRRDVMRPFTSSLFAYLGGAVVCPFLFLPEALRLGQSKYLSSEFRAAAKDPGRGVAVGVKGGKQCE